MVAEVKDYCQVSLSNAEFCLSSMREKTDCRKIKMGGAAKLPPQSIGSAGGGKTSQDSLFSVV